MAEDRPVPRKSPRRQLEKLSISPKPSQYRTKERLDRLLAAANQRRPAGMPRLTQADLVMDALIAEIERREKELGIVWVEDEDDPSDQDDSDRDR